MTPPTDPRFAIGQRWITGGGKLLSIVGYYNGRPELEGGVTLTLPSGRIRAGFRFAVDDDIPKVCDICDAPEPEGLHQRCDIPVQGHPERCAWLCDACNANPSRMIGTRGQPYGMDSCRHLNDDNDGATIGIESIAVQVERLNYGMHRLLSALVRARLARKPGDVLALGIKALLDRGLF